MAAPKRTTARAAKSPKADTADAVSAAGPSDGEELNPSPPTPSAGPSGTHKISKGHDFRERDHVEGCPAQRIETYPAQTPDGKQLKTSHCLDCGATRSV